jgi:hypothetical protein
MKSATAHVSTRGERLLFAMDDGSPIPTVTESREQRMARILSGDVARFVRPASALTFDARAEREASARAREARRGPPDEL